MNLAARFCTRSSFSVFFIVLNSRTTELYSRIDLTRERYATVQRAVFKVSLLETKHRASFLGYICDMDTEFEDERKNHF